MDEDMFKIGCFALIVLVVVVFIGVFSIFESYVNPETIQGTVVDSYIKRYGESDYFHVVVQFDNGSKEIFKNRDALWFGKFNSADVQQTIEIGKRYEFDIRGTRWPLMSWFRNIVEVHPITK